MLGKLKQRMMMNCREATLMMAKRDEGRLGFTDRVRLLVHNSLCAVCKRFDRQVSDITQKASGVESDAVLSAAARDRIKKMIDQF